MVMYVATGQSPRAPKDVSVNVDAHAVVGNERCTETVVVRLSTALHSSQRGSTFRLADRVCTVTHLVWINLSKLRNVLRIRTRRVRLHDLVDFFDNFRKVGKVRDAKHLRT